MQTCETCRNLEVELVGGNVEFREHDYEIYWCGQMKALQLPFSAEQSKDDALYRFIMLKRTYLAFIEDDNLYKENNCPFYRSIHNEET